MHLAVVTETYPPEINGVAMTWGHLAAGLASRGHRVTVFRPRQHRADSGSTSGSLRQVTVRGCPVPGYPQTRFGLPAPLRLARAWRADPPHLVHIVTEGPLGLSALWTAQRIGIPLSSSYHTHFQQYTSHYGYGYLQEIALAYLRAVHNATRATFAPTRELIAELAGHGFVRLRLLSRGVDTRQFSPARRNPALRTSWGASPDSPVVVHSSRVAPEKNYALLLRAYAAMHAARSDARFVIVGDGPLRASLQRENPGIHFTGFVARDALAEVLASADIYVHASSSETFGNVVTEAMASGLALVGFDYAAARVVIRHGENGLLAPLGDDERLIALAAGLVADVDRARSLGRAARLAAEHVSWDRVIATFDADLRLIATHDPRPAPPPV